MEGPSQAGDILVAWLIPWPALRHVRGQGQEKQCRRAEICSSDTAGIEECAQHSRVHHRTFPFMW